jgi:hypothetical protein
MEAYPRNILSSSNYPEILEDELTKICEKLEAITIA